MTIDSRGGAPGRRSSAGLLTSGMTSGRGTLHRLPDRGDDVPGIVVGHGGEERQGDDAGADLLGDREGAGAIAVTLAVVGMEVDGLEVQAGADSPDFEPVHELRPLGRKDGEEMPGVDLAVGRG